MNTLATLVTQRVAAKLAEDVAVEARRKVDALIAAAMKDPTKDEGSVSAKVDGYKVTTTFGITRKVDTAALQDNWERIGDAAQGAFKWKAEVTTAAYKALSGDDAMAASYFVTSAPSTPQVKVEVVTA